MTYNLSYDYCSIVLIGVLLFFYFVTPKYKSVQNKLFGVILVANFISVILDALSAGFLFPYHPNEIIINRIVLSLYQLGQHALAPVYYVYLILVVFPDDGILRLKKRILVLIPGIFVEFVNLISPITQWAFTYDENGYGRTWFYFLSWVVMAFYMILCLCIVFLHRKNTGFLPKLAVVFYSGVSILSAWVQYMRPGDLVISFAASVTIFTMYMALQSPILLKQALEDAEKSKRIAEEANEAKSNFLANMSHEIRTPMNAICGMTYLLESFDLKTDARDYVSTIQSASENLMSLINDILDFSKVDSGRMELTESEYRGDALIREIDGMILNSIDGQRVVPTLFIDSNVPTVLKGDVTKIKQILYNLLNNAIKFTEDGTVFLNILCKEKTGNKVKLAIKVSDTGIGIREEDMGKIFAQFSQVDMAKNRRREGTGLGLALVKGYCDLMNGSIEVDSEFGSGSTFTATIEQEIVEENSAEYLKRLREYVYIILEPNPYVRRSMEMTMKDLKLSYVIEEKFSTEAFEKFSSENYCLIYNYAVYGDIIEATDLKKCKGLFKLALVDFTFRIPEDCKDVHFSRNPFSIHTLIDSLGTVRPVVDESDEERVFFSDKVRVAIVDDNKVNLKVTKAILGKFGIEARTMLSGYEILDELGSGEQYDLIFMDHMMPDLDGVETVRRIRAMHKGNTGNVPIVALTANAVEGAKEEYLEAGMNDALFKPVNVDDLQRVLLKLLPAGMRIDPPK